jgi:large subunit ribosomal protein L18
MIKRPDKNAQRLRRHRRIRNRISGTPEHPRLCVFRSLSNIYAQVIDDVNGRTIVSASSLDKSISKEGPKKDIARQVGILIAKRARDAGVENVVFDRGGYLYHGRIRELADGAREGGLKF